MSEMTRREALSRLAASVAAAGAVDSVLAREVHALVRQAGAYTPRGLSARQFRTLVALADLIIPVDDGRAGAVDADVPAWIDALVSVNADLESRYQAGLSWLDATMQARHGRDFADASPGDQTRLLDQIAFQKNRSPELDPGIDFFVLARRMTVDGFYTSDAGRLEINPGGRPPHRQFVVPQEAIDYVIGQSPFR